MQTMHNIGWVVLYFIKCNSPINQLIQEIVQNTLDKGVNILLRGSVDCRKAFRGCKITL